MRTRPLNIAIRQEAVIIDRENLVFDPLLDQPLGLQRLGEMLGQADIGRVRGAAEIVIAQGKPVARPLLNIVLLVTIGTHIHARSISRQLGRCAVLVGGADIEDVMAAEALEARIHIRRQHRAGQIAQMLDAIDVGKSAGDQYTGHNQTSSLTRISE